MGHIQLKFPMKLLEPQDRRCIAVTPLCQRPMAKSCIPASDACTVHRFLPPGKQHVRDSYIYCNSHCNRLKYPLTYFLLLYELGRLFLFALRQTRIERARLILAPIAAHGSSDGKGRGVCAAVA